MFTHTREVVVPTLPVIVLQARCENRIIDILFFKKVKPFSHLPLNRSSFDLHFFLLEGKV